MQDVIASRCVDPLLLPDMNFLHKVAGFFRRRLASAAHRAQDLFINRGQQLTETESSQPHIPVLSVSDSFDSNYYALNNPDIAANNSDLFDHFMQQGWKEGRSPSADFSTTFYLACYPDVKKAGINPLVHWLVHGQKEGRQANPLDQIDLRSIYIITPEITISEHVLSRLQHLAVWWLSEYKDELVREAIGIDPEIGSFEQISPSLHAPFYDKDYTFVRQALCQLRDAHYDCVILMPHGKLGGADLIGGFLSNSLCSGHSTLIIRTDSTEWERPDWYPDEVPSLDLSNLFKEIHAKTRALYIILACLNPRHIFNVNSRLAFETFSFYGRHLAMTHKLHCYYFCSDLDHSGNERGYPVDYFRKVLPYLKSALIDSRYLMNKLIARYSLPAEQQAKLHLLYSPCRDIVDSCNTLPIVVEQIKTQANRKRPRILWAGRLDKQKRFDLVIQIAVKMRHVDFLVWGKAVLDDPPDMSYLPENLTIHSPFKSHQELPLSDSDGWLYTSEWDGTPNMLIEVGSLGMPIVASAVGRIPELISNSNGWLVRDFDDPESYVVQLNDMLSNPEERRLRASRLRDHIKIHHSQLEYNRIVSLVLS